MRRTPRRINASACSRNCSCGSLCTRATIGRPGPIRWIPSGRLIDVDQQSDASPDVAPSTVDPVTPFVLGGSLRFTGRGAVSVALLLAFAMLPVRGLLRSPGSSMEEGFMLVFPRLVQDGRVPNVDFLHLYGPGSLDALAGWYWIFGYTLEAERAFGLLQNLGIIVALYALARPWGRAAAVLSGVIAALLTMTPIGLAALSRTTPTHSIRKPRSATQPR